MRQVTKIVIVGISILFAACYNFERNCKDFKTGKFIFEYKVDGKKQTTFFERKDSIEIETFNGKIDTSTIRWVNDCEYVLTKKNPKTIQEKKAIFMKILSTTKDSYTFEFAIVGNNNKQVGTAKRAL